MRLASLVADNRNIQQGNKQGEADDSKGTWLLLFILWRHTGSCSYIGITQYKEGFIDRSRRTRITPTRQHTRQHANKPSYIS